MRILRDTQPHCKCAYVISWLLTETGKEWSKETMKNRLEENRGQNCHAMDGLGKRRQEANEMRASS